MKARPTLRESELRVLESIDVDEIVRFVREFIPLKK